MSPTLQPQRSIKMLLSLTSVLLCTLLFFSSCGSSQHHGVLGASLTTSLRRQPQQQASKISIVDMNKKTTKSLSSSSSLYVPIYVMMPLDLVSLNGALNNLDHVTSQLRQLKSVGVDGIMIDVWWGIVQKDGYQKFNWSPYDQLFALCKTIGLKIQANLAFHQCGTNVGDSCYIPLPAWVMAEKSTVPDGLFYKDREGHQDEEYLSLGTDTVPLFQGGRLTSVDLYAEFMSSFQKRYASWIGVDNLISSIEIGLGPAGELRYPSYQLQNNIWSFPGIGEFQCYDKYMLQSLNRSAYAAGHPEWSHGGPMDAGQYNSQPPSSVPFFADGGWNNWESDYGKFFVSWYSKQLIAHGDRILSHAFSIFVQSANNTMSKPTIAAKIAGIHWWYNTRSHAAELTAGYYNTDKYDGYTDIAQMLKKYDAEFAFTCLEMLDQNQQNCNCAPQELVQETRNAAWSTGVRFSGENALPIYNYQAGYDQIVSQSVYNGRAIDSFTYLRLDDQLFQGNAWNMFSNFVSRMHNL